MHGVVQDITDRKLAEIERERLNTELQEALDEVKTLRGIVPICMYCNRIRDDDGYWHQVDAYVADRTHARFAHGLCKVCEGRHFPVEAT